MKNHNNKKIVFNLIAILVYFLSQFVFANEDVINGSAKLYDKTFKSLRVNGSLDFANLIVQDEFVVNGSASGTTLTCKSFTINGSMDGKNFDAIHGLVKGSFNGVGISVSKEMKVFGSMLVSRGIFSTIEITGIKSKLVNTKVKNILIKKIESEKQQLILNGTIVFGDVVFESGSGIVYLSKDSKIYGKVIGATVKVLLHETLS